MKTPATGTPSGGQKWARLLDELNAGSARQKKSSTAMPATETPEGVQKWAKLLDEDVEVMRTDRAPEEILSSLGRNAVRAVRALGDELSRRISEERSKADARENLPYDVGARSEWDQSRILSALLEAFGIAGASASLTLTPAYLAGLLRAEKAVAAFLEKQGAEEEQVLSDLA